MRIPATALAAIALLALTTGPAGAKSFSLDRLHAEVTVYDDGSARIVESLTYSFDGRFRYAFRNIPLRAGDQITDVTVSEAGNEYTRSISEIAGSYTVATQGDEVVIKWYYRANDETRTFDIAYTVVGACARHDDTGEFYLTIFDNGTGARVGEVSTRVEFPGRIPPTNMRAFAHGPLHGEVEIVSASVVRARVAPLWNQRYFDVRVLLPAETFAGMASDGSQRLEAILAQERQWAEEADRRREQEARRRAAWRAERERRAALARTFLPVSILLGLVSLATWFVYFRRYGWPHEVTVHAAPGAPPSDHAPALVSYLLSRAVGGPALVATLIDLSERGHLRIVETTREKKGWFGSASTEKDYRFERADGRDALQPFERSLVDFALGEVGDGRSFSMSEFKKHASKKRTAVRKWFVAWTKMVKEAGKKEGFFEPYDTSAVLVNVFMGVGVLVAGIVLSAMTSSPIGVPAIACGALQAVLTVTFTRHTPEARRHAVAWKAFRDHLKSMSRAMGRVSLSSHDWSRYLAVAIVFGMHKKLLPAMAITDDYGAHGYPAWYVATAGDGGVSSMADGLSSMISSVSTTMSSSTGAGGGASAGGGGGAGGGSAGAG